MNATAELCARHGKAPDAGTQDVNRIQQLERRRSIELTWHTDRNNRFSYFLSIFFLSVSFSAAYFLVCFLSLSSPLFSHMVLFIRPLFFNS
jgi:hypothetical protein